MVRSPSPTKLINHIILVVRWSHQALFANVFHMALAHDLVSRFVAAVRFFSLWLLLLLQMMIVFHMIDLAVIADQFEVVICGIAINR